MTTELNEINKQNPTIDTSNVTVAAFNAIKDKEKAAKTSYILGKDDETFWTSPNFVTKVKAWTQDDDQTHTYFHSLSIDVNVEDFMGTAELKCPYDSDLMEYWEPIRQTVVIYGANRGDYKILFIGRVRELKQDGYELVITFQNYGWKFKQDVSQSYAKDNVLGKDGYTIMRLMFEALKIDSWVISESAKKRLKQVGINDDGNLTVNGEEIEEIPDLIDRLKESDPSKLVNKDTLNNKLREKYLHNIKDINYTLKYEEPTAVMKKISSEGKYTAGSNIYSQAYGSGSGGGGAGADGSSGGSSGSGSSGGTVSRNGCSINIRQACPQTSKLSNSIAGYLNTIYFYNHNCDTSYQAAHDGLVAFAKNSPATYSSSVAPCLSTISKLSKNKSGINAASITKRDCDNIARTYGAARSVGLSATNTEKAINTVAKTVDAVLNYTPIVSGLYKAGKALVQGAQSFIGGLFK